MRKQKRSSYCCLLATDNSTAVFHSKQDKLQKISVSMKNRQGNICHGKQEMTVNKEASKKKLSTLIHQREEQRIFASLYSSGKWKTMLLWKLVHSNFWSFPQSDEGNIAFSKCPEVKALNPLWLTSETYISYVVFYSSFSNCFLQDHIFHPSKNGQMCSRRVRANQICVETWHVAEYG